MRRFPEWIGSQYTAKYLDRLVEIAVSGMDAGKFVCGTHV